MTSASCETVISVALASGSVDVSRYLTTTASLIVPLLLGIIHAIPGHERNVSMHPDLSRLSSLGIISHAEPPMIASISCTEPSRAPAKVNQEPRCSAFHAMLT